MDPRALLDEMFRAALQDAGLPEPELEALVTALTLATGSEAMIALFDIARTDPDPARATVALVAETLLDRFLPGT